MSDGKVKKTADLSTDSREAVKRARLGIKSNNLETARQIVEDMPPEDVLKIYNIVRDRLNQLVGELPTTEESWLVSHGDKVTAVRMVRARLSCDLDTALKVLSLVNV